MQFTVDPEPAVDQLKRMVSGNDGWADAEPNAELARRLSRMPEEVPTVVNRFDRKDVW